MTAQAPGRAKQVKVEIPKLFFRGKKKIYYFRMTSKGKDTWISTRTSDLQKAKKIAEATVRSKIFGEESTGDSINDVSRKITKIIIHGVTGRKDEEIRIGDIHKKWEELCQDYADFSAMNKNYYKGVVEQFIQWCENNNIKKLEEVDKTSAIKYSKHLWKSSLSGKTFNEHIRILSRIFSTLDTALSLPNRNPFDKSNIARKRKQDYDIIGHNPVEPQKFKDLLEEAAAYGKSYRDLFIVGSQTGMRLKDAALLKWKEIDGDFIEITPYKTKKAGNKARIPVSNTLRKMLEERYPAMNKA